MTTLGSAISLKLYLLMMLEWSLTIITCLQYPWWIEFWKKQKLGLFLNFCCTIKLCGIQNVKTFTNFKKTICCQKIYLQTSLPPKWRHNIQDNDTQHNITHHNRTQHNDIQHLMTLILMTLSIMTLCITKPSVMTFSIKVN